MYIRYLCCCCCCCCCCYHQHRRHHYLLFNQIKTVGGARIVATLLRRGMNIDIYLSAADFGKTEGLCGTYDQDPNNDFIPKGQTMSVGRPQVDQFIESWRYEQQRR